MENKSNRLLKNTLILSFGTVCTKGIMFFMTPLFTRWLTQSDYGFFDLFGSYITLLIPIITLGACDAVFRFLADKNLNDNVEPVRKILSIAVFETVIGLLITIVIILVICLFSKSFRNFLPMFIVLLFFETIFTFISYVIRGLKKLSVYTISNIVFTISMAVSSIVFVYLLKGGLGGVILSYSIGYFVGIIYSVCRVQVWKYISIKNIEIETLKDMLKYSLPLIPSAISWWIINASDRTIISMFLGTTANAIYAVANKIPNLCQTLYNAFHLSWQENVVETFEDCDKDAYYSSVMNEMIQLIGSVCMIVLAADFIIFEVLFPSSYYSAYYQVPILMLALVFHMMAQFLGGIYIAQRNSKKAGGTTVFAAMVNIITNLSLISFVGLYAATISTFISYFVLFIVRYIDIRKKNNINIVIKSYAIIGILFYMFVCVYIRSSALNVINMILSVLFFVIINKKILKKFKALLYRGN